MKPTEELQPASCAWRGGRGSLVALLAVGFATAALVAVFNFYGFENAASMASAGSGEHGLGPTVALEQQRNAQMLEEILSVLRTKSFISAANATEEGVESPLDNNNETADLKETEKLLQRAEELLAEKLLQEHEHTDNTNTDSVQTNDNHHNKRPIDPLERFPANHDGSQIHIVFSMSCNHRNRVLQEIVLQLTATWAGQTGPITQILSDCSEEDREKVLLEPTFYYDFRRHFTPNFAANPEPGSDDWYAAYNKPFGLRHFLLNADPPVQHEILALIDGDFYFFRPIEVNTGRDVSRYYSGKRDPATVNDTVTDGLAVAQDWTNVNKDGFYLDERREMLDSVCAGLPCGNVSREDAVEFYANVGPPYIMTVNDVRRMVDDYCHLCVTSRKVSKEWMTEMFAYSVAVANNGIKHTALTNLGITSPGYSYDGREYWGFVDETMANPCEDNLEYVHPKDPPMTVHTCQWIHNYYKGLIPETIANCESPMLKNLPPSEWTDIDANVDQDRRHIRRQEVWGKCSIIKLTNRALLELKQRTCPQGFNTFRNVTAVNLG